MKWEKNDVVFQRSCYRPVIFRFDTSQKWLTIDANCSTGSIRGFIRNLGTVYGASSVEVRWMYDKNDKLIVDGCDIVSVTESDGRFLFRQELCVPEGQRRKFRVFQEADIFPKGKLQKFLCDGKEL